MNSPGQESRPNFTTQNVKKHRKLISPRLYIIMHILSPAFFHPHFSIRHPPSAIRHPPSAIRGHPVLTLHRPLYVECQALFVFMLCSGGNLRCINPGLVKTCYSRRPYAMCCVNLGKSSLLEILGIRWAIEFFPKGSFLYQHSAALENFVNGL